MSTRRPTSMLPLIALALVAAACASPAPSAGPSPSLPTSPSAASPSAQGSLAPGVTPLAPPSPTESASSTGCPAAPAVTGPWPFARLVSVDARTDASIGADVVTFGFDAGTGPGGVPTAVVGPVQPPFVQGGSGAPVEIDGGAFIQLKLDAMVVADEAGQPVYDGPPALAPDLPIVKAVAQLEAFEGVVSWVVGYRGPTCVSLVTDVPGRQIELQFSHAVP